MKRSLFGKNWSRVLAVNRVVIFIYYHSLSMDHGKLSLGIFWKILIDFDLHLGHLQKLSIKACCSCLLTVWIKITCIEHLVSFEFCKMTYWYMMIGRRCNPSICYSYTVWAYNDYVSARLHIYSTSGPDALFKTGYQLCGSPMLNGPPTKWTCKSLLPPASLEILLTRTNLQITWDYVLILKTKHQVAKLRS